MHAFVTAIACVCLVLQRASAEGGASNNESPEKLLRFQLFESDGYDKLVRPVKNHTDRVPVWVAITPLKLRDLDEKNHVIELDTWLVVKWVDEFLRWKPEDYSGVQYLTLPITELWSPDISLYTGTPDKAVLPFVMTRAYVNHTGEVLWVPPFTVKSKCPMGRSKDISEQVKCNIRIGSWTYSNVVINLKDLSERVSMEDYDDSNPDWKLASITTVVADKKYACCKENYTHVDFNLSLQRKLPSVKKMLLNDGFHDGLHEKQGSSSQPNDWYKFLWYRHMWKYM